MIQYDSSDWLGLVFSCSGTVWPSIRPKFILVSLYSVAAYLISEVYDINFGTEGRTMFFSSMSVLLIFRANQAFTRYWIGRTTVAEFYSGCREFISLALDFSRGGVRTSVFTYSEAGRAAEQFAPDRFDGYVKELRLDLVRLTVACSVALRLHTLIAAEGYCFGSVDRDTKWQIDWERFRLRQLMTEQEFRLVDACVGLFNERGERGGGADPLRYLAKRFEDKFGPDAEPPEQGADEFQVDMASHPRPFVAICQLLRDLVFLHMNGPDNAQPWGIKERFVSELFIVLGGIQSAFDGIDQIICTPLPLPYANICKTSLAVFLVAMPFFVDYRLGWFANTVIPIAVMLALMGIDAIATELENPFGTDANDLDLLQQGCQLEREGVELLRLSGPLDVELGFVWRPLPAFVSSTCSRSLHHYLAVKELSPGCEELAGEPELSIEAYHLDSPSPLRSRTRNGVF